MKKLFLSVALLGLSSVAMADLSATCKTYFDKVDALFKAIPDDAATKQQWDLMKQNLEAGKQQISSMPESQQETACKQGNETLKQLEASMPKK